MPLTPPHFFPDPAAASGDPLARLHKMSTTAGATSAQYVAVNTLAIVALLIGLASAVSLVGNVLLALPAAGLVLALISLRQIHNSNGTQTGRILALAGLILCLAMGAAVLVRHLVNVSRARVETGQIARVISDLGEDLNAGRMSDAYALFTPEFRADLPLPQFTVRWNGLQRQWLGKIKGMRWNGIAPEIKTIAGGAVPTTDVDVLIDCEMHGDDRFTVTLRKIDGSWEIHQMEPLFMAVSKPSR